MLRRIFHRIRAALGEQQLCPQRSACGHLFARTPKTDHWRTLTWGFWLFRRARWLVHDGPCYHALQRCSHWLWKHEHYKLANFFNVYGGGESWEWGWQPRTCSYCGSVHPADALKLLREGWEIDPSDKRYKAYLQPPRYRATLLHMLTCTELPKDYWSPVPPVKLYTHHCTQQQIDELNKAAKLRIIADDIAQLPVRVHRRAS